MYKVNVSLKLVTKCSVVGKDIPTFVDRLNNCGFFTYIEDCFEDEEFDDNDEVDVMVFDLVQKSK